MLKSFLDIFKRKKKEEVKEENKNIENCETDFWNDFENKEKENLNLGEKLEIKESEFTKDNQFQSESKEETFDNYFYKNKEELTFKNTCLNNNEIESEEKLEIKESEFTKDNQFQSESKEETFDDYFYKNKEELTFENTCLNNSEIESEEKLEIKKSEFTKDNQFQSESKEETFDDYFYKDKEELTFENTLLNNSEIESEEELEIKEPEFTKDNQFQSESKEETFDDYFYKDKEELTFENTCLNNNEIESEEELEIKEPEFTKDNQFQSESKEETFDNQESLNLQNENSLSEEEKNFLINENIDKKSEKVGFFKKLFNGLDKTRKNITDKIDQLIHNYGKIDDELFDELEEILITSDISVDTSMKIIDSLKEELKIRKILDMSLIKDVLVDVIEKYLNTEEETKINIDYPSVIFVIGVNGAGKTTTIGKMANLYKNQGKSVLLAAADTFRAAAIDQLEEWAKRANVDVITKNEGSDPSSVIFDAIKEAKNRKTDVLICDTAGRLHNKVNLMNELKKMFKIINREYEKANIEVLLVLDATTGQNAINQAKLFKDVAPITGLVLTKLDGSAKGGFVISIKNDLDIPVKLIGVGEKIDDLERFKPKDFAKAIIG